MVIDQRIAILLEGERNAFCRKTRRSLKINNTFGTSRQARELISLHQTLVSFQYNTSFAATHFC